WRSRRCAGMMGGVILVWRGLRLCESQRHGDRHRGEGGADWEEHGRVFLVVCVYRAMSAHDDRAFHAGLVVTGDVAVEFKPFGTAERPGQIPGLARLDGDGVGVVVRHVLAA